MGPQIKGLGNVKDYNFLKHYLKLFNIYLLWANIERNLLAKTETKNCTVT